MQPSLEIENLGVRYDIRREWAGSITDLITDIFRRHARETLWAVRGVDLRVYRGEVLGVIGRN